MGNTKTDENAIADVKQKYNHLVSMKDAAGILPDTSVKTLRNWRASGINSRMFVQLNGRGRVYVDLNEVDKIIEDDKEKTLRDIKRLRLDD